MNQVNATVRFRTHELVNYTYDPLWRLVDEVAKELGVWTNNVSFDEDCTVVRVENLEDLFKVCQKFDPSVYVSVQLEKVGEHGSDYLSLTVDD
jgi:hypothetical protein